MTVDQAAGERSGLAEAPVGWDAAGEQVPVIRLDHHRRRDGERPIRVLVVGAADDFADIRDLLARAEQARFAVDRVTDTETALARLARRQHDVCLCDQHLPGGLGLARQAAQRGDALPVILMSGSAEPNLDLEAIAAGAADFFDKEQFAVESLERAIRMALVRARRSHGPDPFEAAPAQASGDDAADAFDPCGLELAFQPQVPFASALLTLTATVRWRDPTAAPYDGDRLDDWLIAAACRQARRWQKAGLPAAQVAVPLPSGRPLRWSNLARRLEASLGETGLAPERLELELDEQLLLDDLANGGAALREASALGVRLAVAGFGTGAMALAVLRDAPLATVKLDGAVLRDDDQARPSLAAGLIRLVRERGLRLVAERIEGRRELELVRTHGCDAVQAAMLCPPLPVEGCTSWLREACPIR